MYLVSSYTWYINRGGICLVCTWYMPYQNFVRVPDEVLSSPSLLMMVTIVIGLQLLELEVPSPADRDGPGAGRQLQTGNDKSTVSD